MHRRPKLSLVQNRELKKKQALDFAASDDIGSEVPLTSETESAVDASSEGPEESFRTERLVSEQERASASQPGTWPSGRTVLKAVAIIATVALTFYLVKRRLL